MDKLEAQIQQFKTALSRLKEVLEMSKTEARFAEASARRVVRYSAIQRFEFTLDLSWKTVKTYLEEKRGLICASPKECFREAYRQGMIAYDAAWLALVDLRNETVHTYDEKTAERIYAQLPMALKHFESLSEKIALPVKRMI